MKASQNFELELKKIDADSSRFAHKCDVIKKGFQSLTILGCIFALAYCLVKVAECSTDSIAALSAFVKNLKMSNIILGLSNTVWLGLYYKERKGKKRAISKKGEYQRIAESNEPNRSSSGLTATGDTPK